MMNKSDFRSILSEAFGKYDKTSKKFLRESFERYDKKSKKFLRNSFERNNKKLIREFNRFVDISIIPQFEEIHVELRGMGKRLNDVEHRQDKMLRTLEKHEDRLDHLGSRQDKVLQVLEKQDDRLERIEAKL